MTRALLRTAATLTAWLYAAYFATLRVRITRADGLVTHPTDYPRARCVVALCERDTLAVSGTLGSGFTVLTTPSRDGEFAGGVLGALGCRVVRGATRRYGAEAMRQLIRLVRDEEHTLGLVVDGPLGPSGQPKPGAVLCAIKARSPLYALGAAARHHWVFPRTWSGMYLPMPFSRVAIVLTRVDLPFEATRQELAALTSSLGASLAEARATAVQRVGDGGW